MTTYAQGYRYYMIPANFYNNSNKNSFKFSLLINKLLQNVKQKLNISCDTFLFINTEINNNF